MRTSLNFESESFNGSDSIDSSFAGFPATPAENSSDEWGVVSNNGSEMDDGHDSGSSRYMNGVLILDGVESNVSSPSEPSDLSMPGTDSLPSDLGSLSDGIVGVFFPDDDSVRRESWAIRKRSAFILSVMCILFSFAGMVFHLFERNSWRSSTLIHEQAIQKLKQENERLLREKERIKTTYESSPPWSTPDDKESDFVTLVDNCWFKAKGSLKVGECGEKASEYPKALFGNLVGMMSQVFDEAFETNDASRDGACAEERKEESQQDGSSKERKEETKAFEDDGSVFESFPLVLGEVIVAASKTFSSKIKTHFKDTIHESGDATSPDFETTKAGLSQATEALSEAVNAATGAMALELKELKDDPLNYLASAVKGASHTAKKQKVTMGGFFGAADAVSTAWGEALGETHEALTVKMTEVMDDPLSYFEYKSSKSKKE